MRWKMFQEWRRKLERRAVLRELRYLANHHFPERADNARVNGYPEAAQVMQDAADEVHMRIEEVENGQMWPATERWEEDFARAMRGPVPEASGRRWLALPNTHFRNEPVVRVTTCNGKVAGIDQSIAPLVRALNDAGFQTIASCSGHGVRPASIILEGDMEMLIMPRSESELIQWMWPDINNERLPMPEGDLHLRRDSWRGPTGGICPTLDTPPAPQAFRDGDQWCCLYGKNIQEGVSGFGPTAEKAGIEFAMQWVNAPEEKRARLLHEAYTERAERERPADAPGYQPHAAPASEPPGDE